MRRSKTSRSESGSPRRTDQGTTPASVMRRDQGPAGLRGASRDDDGRGRRTGTGPAVSESLVHSEQFEDVKADVYRRCDSLGPQLLVRVFYRVRGTWRPADGDASLDPGTQARVAVLADRVLAWVLDFSFASAGEGTGGGTPDSSTDSGPPQNAAERRAEGREPAAQQERDAEHSNGPHSRHAPSSALPDTQARCSLSDQLAGGPPARALRCGAPSRSFSSHLMHLVVRTVSATAITGCSSMQSAYGVNRGATATNLNFRDGYRHA